MDGFFAIHRRLTTALLVNSGIWDWLAPTWNSSQRIRGMQLSSQANDMRPYHLKIIGCILSKSISAPVMIGMRLPPFRTDHHWVPALSNVTHYLATHRLIWAVRLVRPLPQPQLNKHWSHIRTNNPIESNCSTIRLRTDKVRNGVRLGQCAEKWRIRLHHPEHLSEVIRGVNFSQRNQKRQYWLYISEQDIRKFRWGWPLDRIFLSFSSQK